MLRKMVYVPKGPEHTKTGIRLILCRPVSQVTRIPGERNFFK